MYVCVCVCVCVCVHIHTHIHTYIHAYTHTYMHTCIHRRQASTRRAIGGQQRGAGREGTTACKQNLLWFVPCRGLIAPPSALYVASTTYDACRAASIRGFRVRGERRTHASSSSPRASAPPPPFQTRCARPGRTGSTHRDRV